MNFEKNPKNTENQPQIDFKILEDILNVHLVKSGASKLPEGFISQNIDIKIEDLGKETAGEADVDKMKIRINSRHLEKRPELSEEIIFHEINHIISRLNRKGKLPLPLEEALTVLITERVANEYYKQTGSKKRIDALRLFAPYKIQLKALRYMMDKFSKFANVPLETIEDGFTLAYFKGDFHPLIILLDMPEDLVNDFIYLFSFNPSSSFNRARLWILKNKLSSFFVDKDLKKKYLELAKIALTLD